MPLCEICKYRKTKLFHKIDNYSYYSCSRCYTLFLCPKPTQKQISSYYSKDFKYPAGEANEIIIRKRAKIILSNLRKFHPAGKNLLDIGSGYGYFIDEAAEFGLKTIGIEPSKKLYSILIKHLSEKIYLTDFSRFYAKNKNKKFDFITIIHTIEHVTNPADMIVKASSLLNKNGLLYIETPNLDSHLFNAEKYNYTFLTPPDHIWIFSLKSFYSMLRKTPKIQIEQISTYSYPEHFMGVIKTLVAGYSKVILGTNPSTKLRVNSLRTPESNSPGLSRISGCAPTLTAYQNDKNRLKKLKYLFFDQLLAPVLTPLLNMGGKGSVLELYIKKK